LKFLVVTNVHQVFLVLQQGSECRIKIFGHLLSWVNCLCNTNSPMHSQASTDERCLIFILELVARWGGDVYNIHF